MDKSPKYLDEIIDKKIYPKSVEMGKKFYDAFRGEGKSQLRKLQTLAYSTSRFTEILNFIKNQIGKDTQRKWTSFGEELLEELKGLQEMEKGKLSSTHLLYLARAYIDGAVNEYLYLAKK
ncbi:MAG: hypothetical protein D6805_08830 [Planctomycetota bacterium]|nr:MAG: hypothetical protein D6805_08830 [Planctomycetota bacterium]